MFSTFERELIANQRHQEMLQSFARRERIAQATGAGRTTGLVATIVARLRGTATEAQPTATATASA